MKHPISTNFTERGGFSQRDHDVRTLRHLYNIIISKKIISFNAFKELFPFHRFTASCIFFVVVQFPRPPPFRVPTFPRIMDFQPFLQIISATVITSLIIIAFQYVRKITHFPALCGERGIRTPGTVPGTHAFQACQINHSCTSPIFYRHCLKLRAAN